MNLEQLALMGIVVFAVMALATSFNAIRSIKKARGEVGLRPRRLIGNAESARLTAIGLVREATGPHEDLVAHSREAGRVLPELEEALAETREYFVERVEARHRVQFNRAVDEVVLGDPDDSQGPASADASSEGE